MRALIVDDSSFVREYLKELMRKMGIEFREAANGAEALKALREGGDFDLMLCDVNMPVMDGLECVKTLRLEGLQLEMKVMMVTTEADHSFIHEALAYGADEFLMKPFTPQSLREKMAMLGLELTTSV
jgi:two-component system chemotaxis response regulator CheY